MTADQPLRPVGDPEDEGDGVEAVDLDLDVESEALRKEAVRAPTTVRVSGTVIHIQHAGDWTQTAMLAASNGNWEVWARLVIDNDDEYQVWMDADLRNYQIEAVFAESARAAKMSMGKPSRPSGPSRRSRRR